MRTLAVSVLDTLRRRLDELDPALHPLASAVLERREAALSLFHELLDRPDASPRIRCHGNLHLGQVLHAGGDLVILDFDGEPGRPLYERRLKRSPLHDVATMVRSFHYAAHGALYQLNESPGWTPSSTTPAWIASWQLHMSAVFIDAYTRSVDGTKLLPSDPDEARLLFRTYLVERAFYELGFELNHRRNWIAAPLADLPLLLAPDVRM
jgi:maltose alpha-D-glucosyltransferase/alpha-amylase